MSAPHEIISDEEIMRVHGHANFGDMSPREVVNDGVLKYAVGYTGGHTQLCILRRHGLITMPHPGKYSANLTQKGKRYARSIWNTRTDAIPNAAYVAGLEAALMRILPQNLGPLPESMPDSETVPVDMTFGEIRQSRAALASRPASPDVRVVAVEMLREWENTWHCTQGDRTDAEISCIAEIRAIIAGQT